MNDKPTQAEIEIEILQAKKELEATLAIVKALAPYSHANKGRLLEAVMLLMQVSESSDD